MFSVFDVFFINTVGKRSEYALHSTRRSIFSFVSNDCDEVSHPSWPLIWIIVDFPEHEYHNDRRLNR